MKVLFGTYDESNIFAKRQGWKHDDWKHWGGNLLGLRLKGEDIIILGSWWSTVRSNLPAGKLEYIADTLAIRMDRGEAAPDL